MLKQIKNNFSSIEIALWCTSVMMIAVSFGFVYYGEMSTYLGMTMPMAVIALVSWLKNPYNGNKAEVKVNR